MTMRIVAVVQARMATRLPGKVLLPAAGAPLLARMLERVRASGVHEVVVATTEAAADEQICEVVARVGARVVRGDATDLLGRHVAAARAADADVIVRIPSDCPLIDPATIDRVVGAFVRLADIAPVDYVSNLHPATWPAGFDVEVITRGALETAWAEGGADEYGISRYVRAHPVRFVARNACYDGYGLSRMRLALEYPEDYGVIRGIYEDLWSARRHFTLPEILAVLSARPALHARNAMRVAELGGW